MSTANLDIPISEKAVRALDVGDTARLSGVMVTARDAAHKYMVENFIQTDAPPESERPLHAELHRLLREGVIYHCGPVVRRREKEDWKFVAAGPTTSIREEAYESRIIAHFGLRGVIGKGGMGPDTLRACQEHGAAYLHAVGGAASLIADAVTDILTVYKKGEFGAPEALWVIRVRDFPTVVTMDTHGRSIHEEVRSKSSDALERLGVG